MTKKFILLNLIPIIIIDIIAVIISNSSMVMAQLVILPVYFLITLDVYVIKYKFGIIKGFIIQCIIMFAALYILAFVMLIYGVIATEMTLAQAIYAFGSIGIETAHLLPALVVMVPGTVVIAVVSYVRKKKQIMADKGDKNIK